MTFEGSGDREQGVTFAVVIVKKHVMDNRLEAQDAIQAFRDLFPRPAARADGTGLPGYAVILRAH